MTWSLSDLLPLKCLTQSITDLQRSSSCLTDQRSADSQAGKETERNNIHKCLGREEGTKDEAMELHMEAHRCFPRITFQQESFVRRDGCR